MKEYGDRLSVDWHRALVKTVADVISNSTSDELYVMARKVVDSIAEALHRAGEDWHEEGVKVATHGDVMRKMALILETAKSAPEETDQPLSPEQGRG